MKTKSKVGKGKTSRGRFKRISIIREEMKEFDRNWLFLKTFLGGEPPTPSAKLLLFWFICIELRSVEPDRNFFPSVMSARFSVHISYSLTHTHLNVMQRSLVTTWRFYHLTLQPALFCLNFFVVDLPTLFL